MNLLVLKIYDNYQAYEAWYLNDKKHRDNGPARTFVNKEMEWFCNGLRHRINGPAIIYTDQQKSWYINGTRYDKIRYKEVCEEYR